MSGDPNHAPPSWPALTAAIPWLSTLPTGLAAQLDLTEFVLPDLRLAQTCRTLAERTGSLIMTYSRHAQPGKPDRVQLCQVVAPAALRPAQLRLLIEAENGLVRTDVVLCAYEQPLRFQLDAGRSPFLVDPSTARTIPAG